jgi:hypothetical protein
MSRWVCTAVAVLAKLATHEFDSYSCSSGGQCKGVSVHTPDAAAAVVRHSVGKSVL